MESIQLKLIMLRQKQYLFFEYYEVLPDTYEVIEEITEPEETEVIDDYVETNDVEIIEITIDLPTKDTNANSKVETPIIDDDTTESDNNTPT